MRRTCCHTACWDSLSWSGLVLGYQKLCVWLVWIFLFVCLFLFCFCCCCFCFTGDVVVVLFGGGGGGRRRRGGGREMGGRAERDGGCDVVCIANHSRSISITEYSLCTPKVIIVQKSYSFQHNRPACRTAAHDMLRAQLETCNSHLNPGLSIQSLS